MKKHLLWLAFSLMMMPQISKSQTIDLVKDINLTDLGYGVQVMKQAAAGNIIFFLGYDGVHGTQLWKSDGTKEGTFRLTDISYDAEIELTSLTTTNGLAFCVFPYNNDFWLFRSDGTAAGTVPLVKVSNSLDHMIGVNGTVYFTSWIYDSNVGTRYQLWKSDGTVEGTVPVKEIATFEYNVTGPFDFFNFNGFVYFLAGNRATNSYRLWKTDGTEAGTVPGPAIGSSFKPAAFNGNMYFTENNVLKKTDGITITTVKNLTSLAEPIVLGSAIYFAAAEGTAGTELWKSDGTTAGTVLVKDINPGTDASSYPADMENVNGTLFFSATTALNGRELWKSNGTAAGTVLVSDVYPGGNGNVHEITGVGNQAVFTASNSSGPKVWKSDGTSAGTLIIANFPGVGLINAGGTVFFNGGNVTGTKLYKSNLTLASTEAVTSFPGKGSLPQKIFDVNGTGYFTADNGINGRELWKTNNTTAGTVLVKDILPGSGSSDPDHVTNVNGTLFFVANGQEIWKSSGTSAGTVLVKDVVSAADDKITGLIGLNGILYFGVITSSQTLQLWKSDGTATGTVLITTFLNTGSLAAVAYNGQLYFLAWDGVNSHELWKTNGTAAGTSLVKDISGYRSAIHAPVVANNKIYYFLGNILVKSDGTSAGTTIVKSQYVDDEYYYTINPISTGNLVYFNLIRPTEGTEVLWRTDGTEAGTIPLATFDDPYYEEGISDIRQETAVGGKIFFVPYDNKIGDQLWVSDGTPAGTKMVKKIGQFSSDFTIDQSAVIGDIFYFTPPDPVTGTELWRSDGTSDGTYLVYDLSTNGGTRFYDLTNVNGTLLISADAGQPGAELYKYQPAATLRINSGGAAFTASGSRNFAADQYFGGTTLLSNAVSGNILNTTDDQLYKEQRFGSAFTYNIPVTNGPINVVLHFAEIYWGVPGKGGSGGAGKRRFHVDIEGSRKLTNYDIFTLAGGSMRARTETFTVNVTDGTLNINFLSGAADNPIIAAIEIVPAQLILGPVADATVRNIPNDHTNFGTATTLDIKTGSLPSYQRNTYLKFSLTGVSNVGLAKLRLYGSNTQTSANIGVSAYGVSNDLWAETGITWDNAPAASSSISGSVNVNGTAKYYEIDVTAYVQSQLAGDKTVSLFVTNPANQNTQLSFSSRENTANRPQLIITTMAPPAARVRSEEELVLVQQEPKASGISPNPVAGKHFTVEVSQQHTGDVDLQLMNLRGQTLHIRTKPANTASNFDMDVSSVHFSAGVYLLKIESKAHKEVLKMLVAE